MTKSEFIKEVAGITGATQKQAAEILEAARTAITEALCNGEDVAIPGFGTFTVKERAAREGRNPSTGETVMLEARKAPAFKPGKTLKDEVKAAFLT